MRLLLTTLFVFCFSLADEKKVEEKVEEKSKKGVTKELVLPDFKGLEQKPKSKAVKFSTFCINDSGQKLTSADAGFDSCLQKQPVSKDKGRQGIDLDVKFGDD